MNRINFFRLNRSLHRDLGYLVIGLTLIFSLSGILLNHHHDWNSNYSITQKKLFLSEKEFNELKTLKDEEIISLAQKKFSLKTKMKGLFWSSPHELKAFFPENTTLLYQKKERTLSIEKITPRPLFQAFNKLHLNEAKGYWILFSDTYACILFFLALSALFMVKGKYGIKGRGGILTLIGILIPAYFIIQIL